MRFVEARDGAMALRLLQATAIDCAVVGATANPEEAGEFLVWWAAAPERSALPLFVIGTPAGSIPAGATVLPRDPVAVAAALQAQVEQWLDPTRQVLHGPQGEALLLSLVRVRAVRCRRGNRRRRRWATPTRPRPPASAPI